MKIINIKNNDNYLKEYIKLCNKEWGKHKDVNKYLKRKKEEILNTDKVISILGLIDNELIGFISLFKYEYKDDTLTPWYATMYVKDKYRGKGYSKLLNKAIIDEAKALGYKRLYLKSELKNYYEKFGAKYIKKLDNGESLYYIDVI